ncbi:MAG: hypothetical protein IKW30_02405 [Lachnospiraceae bacterium]|nr:hypothetical protein [Lachnospiraceae bacterium]
MENKTNLKILKRDFEKNFGKANTRTWKIEEMELVSRYAKKRETKQTIDELTWNDLDMDLIYQQMNYTESSFGDDYLFYILKNPLNNEELLQKREEKISCLARNTEKRIQLQILFHKIGRLKRYSFMDCVEYLIEEQTKSNGKHYLVDVFIFLSIILMAFNIGMGVMLFFALILYNIVMYFKHKAYLDPYLASLRYLFKILDYTKEIAKMLPEEWTIERQKLQEILSSMKKIQKNAFLVMSPGRMGGEGLELILDYLRMIFHLDIIKFNQMLGELKIQEQNLWDLYEIIGEMDACIAVVWYRKWLPLSCCPTLIEEKEINMVDGYHPLIENAVTNSFKMKENILLTGSNASGKSTFLKTVAINILLAQTIHTCTAKEFYLPFCSLFTSMSLKDSITLKESYYMAEIKSIKRILDSAYDGNMIVCMIDEVLRGTNTVERIAASTQILKSFSRPNVLCIAATHDVELTKTLEELYENYHFEESMNQGDVVFSYHLMKGIAKSCNAINLLEHLGYDKDLIMNARNMVNIFETQGEWICK